MLKKIGEYNSFVKTAHHWEVFRKKNSTLPHTVAMLFAIRDLGDALFTCTM